MSDTALEKFLHYGTAAERVAFVPVPPPLPTVYVWYETDTGNTYIYDTSWHLITAGSIGLVLTNSVTILNADIKALPSTPVEILPALGSGLTIMPIMVTVRSKFAVAYGNIDPVSAYMNVQYGAPSNDLWSNYLADDATAVIPFTNFSNMFATTNQLRAIFTRFTEVTDVASQWGAMANNITLQDNSSLELTIVNGPGDLSLGDAANTLIVNTYYVVESAL